MFNSNTETLKCDIKNISFKYLVEIVRNTIRKAIIIILLTTHNNTVKDLKWFYKNKGNKKKISSVKDLVPAWRNKYIITVFELLPIPLNTPPEYLFTAVLVIVMLKDTPSKSPLSMWKYKFELV